MNYSNNVSVFYALKETVKLAWKTSWYWLVGIVFLMLLHSGMITFELVIQNRVVDAVSTLTRNTFSQVVALIVIFFIFKSLTNVVMTLRYLSACWFGPRLDKMLKLKTIEKYRKLDMVNYEDEELYNHIERANNSTFLATNAVTNIFQTLSGHITTVIGVMVYLTLLKPKLSLILICAVIPEIINHVYKGKKNYHQEKLVTPVKRRTDYLDSTITSKEYFKETRLLGSYLFLKDLWSKSLKNSNDKEWELKLKLFPMDFFVNLSSFLAYAGTLCLAVFYLYRSEISIGQFAATLTALETLRGKLDAIIRNLGSIYQRSIGARFLYTFLHLNERTGKVKKVHPVNSIVLKDVCFSYNTSTGKTLDHINLNLKKGDIVAIVGNNGAGKTTLVKVLTGLLKPTSGSVIYNGVDIGNINEDSIYKGTSALFQTFGRYQMTLKENVCISDADSMDNYRKIYGSLDYAGFKIDKNKLTGSVDSLLGTEFGGKDLSGGEWQQVALARAYFRDSDLIILDEPTSAIDPIRETQLYEKFMDISRDKIAVLITHRLSAAKIANKIIVMKEGRIAEFGTHDELMEQDHSYAKMYREQAGWYLR